MMAQQQYQERRRVTDDLEQTINNAVRKAFSDVLDGFGVDVTTSQGRQELREDITWVRDARKGTNLLRKTTGVAVITTFVTGAAFGLWTMLMWIATLTKGHGN